MMPNMSHYTKYSKDCIYFVHTPGAEGLKIVHQISFPCVQTSVFEIKGAHTFPSTGACMRRVLVFFKLLLLYISMEFMDKLPGAGILNMCPWMANKIKP